ncbi:hypothetical protein Tco_0067366 [Tanacetum coccineum]
MVEGKPDIDDEKQKKRRKKRSKRNMVLDDDDYRGHSKKTTWNSLPSQVKIDGCDGDSMDASTAEKRPTAILNGLEFDFAESESWKILGRSKGFDVGRALQARSFDFEEAISMVLYGINTLEEFHVTSTIRDVVGNIKTLLLFIQVRLNIKLVQREGNAVLRRHLESLPLESFNLANESIEDSALQADFISLATLLLIRKVAFHKPYIRGLIANFAQLRDMPAEFIQMYCHIAAHKFFSLCDPVRRVLFEEFLYREARIKKILRINGVAPGK